jgi:hypothetical protein
MRFLREIVVAGALACASARAAAGNIDDCEKIKDPMAYNNCLASFGPAVGHVGGTKTYVPPSDVEPPAARGKGRARAFHAPPRRGFGAPVTRGPHGRVRMEFTPKSR